MKTSQSRSGILLRPHRFIRRVGVHRVLTPKALHSLALRVAQRTLGQDTRHPTIPRRGYTNSACGQGVTVVEPRWGTVVVRRRGPRVRCATLGWRIQPLRGRCGALQAWRCATELQYPSIATLPIFRVFRHPGSPFVTSSNVRHKRLAQKNGVKNFLVFSRSPSLSTLPKPGNLSSPCLQ